MARLRVPASPSKSPAKAVDAVSPSTKSKKEPRVRSNVIAYPRPAYNPRATGPIYKDNGVFISKVAHPVPKPLPQMPVKGNAQVLTTFNKEALQDMQSYIAGSAEVVETLKSRLHP
jgi:hypothetical protein